MKIILIVNNFFFWKENYKNTTKDNNKHKEGNIITIMWTNENCLISNIYIKTQQNMK